MSSQIIQHAVIGLEGLSLTDQEKTWLQKHTPKGVILVARNVESSEQTKGLLADVRKHAGKDIWVAIDEEGGRVHRMPWSPFNGRTQAADFGVLFKKDADEAI
ncbi:MAG: beta-N-acetylhexosaminidase, partial [Ghiorsea sp.]|nr:beta-N-acetylhexosaminidase [Ghiorsea sp.]